MDLRARIDLSLTQVIGRVASPSGPPRLLAAVRHAVFPGGARIRPQLCLSVAMACGDDRPNLSDAAASAIELLHCASLVHDDLPCFDDAPLRRGVPSVHRAFGERLAVLSGDALIVMAFQALSDAAGLAHDRAVRLVATVARGVGMPHGIVAGQAWECEPHCALSDYQRAKTGALFSAATMAGAIAAGADGEPWRPFGEALGEAYQVADDIRDVVADPILLGKPIGRDAALGRPSAADAQGVAGAIRRFDQLVTAAAAAIPRCHGAGRLRALLRAEAERLVPQSVTGGATSVPVAA